MDKTRQKLLDEKYSVLSARLKGALDSDVIEALCDEISERYGLGMDAPDKLDEAIRLTILGLSNHKDFTRKIGADLGIDGQIATSIANEISEKMFKPVRDELLALYGIEEGYRGEGQWRGAQYQGRSLISRTDLDMKTRPLSAELEENVGLRPPAPPPLMPQGKPIDVELQESFRKPPAPPRPPAPPVEEMTVIQPPPKPAFGGSDDQIDPKRFGLAPTAPLSPAQRPRPTPSFTPPPQLEPTGIKDTMPLTGQARSQTPQRAYVNQTSNDAPQNDENLSREDILRGIEDPYSIRKNEPSQSFNTPIPGTPKQYDADPYREPLK